MHPEIEQRGPGTLPEVRHGARAEGRCAGDVAEDDGELRDMTRRFWVAAALGVPVLLLAMLPMVGVPVDQWLGHRASSVAATGAGDAGRAVGRLAALGARLAIGRHSRISTCSR